MPVGTRPNAGHRKPVRRVPGTAVRRCVVCRERLSSYNVGPNCYAHSRVPLVSDRAATALR